MTRPVLLRGLAAAAIFSLPVVPLFSQDLQGSPDLASGKDLARFEAGDSIEVLGAKIAHNGFDFQVGHNWVYDMPQEEKAAFFSRHPNRADAADVAEIDDIGPLAERMGTTALPASFDWRSYNGQSYIGPVRNQGGCGSCYSFGAAAAAEGTWNFATGHYVGNGPADFAESYIVWCLGKQSSYSSHFGGCGGADYTYTELQALVDVGICNESVFPYTDTDPQTCPSGASTAAKTKFASWHRVPCGDIDAIKTAIMTYGVVDAAVYVSSAFQAYSTGIYNDSSTACSASPCYDTETNHAISLVGWNDNGDAATKGYWILRNSWGDTDWGESGYMRIRYTAARVSCEVAYLVYNASAPTPTPVKTSTPVKTPTRTPTPVKTSTPVKTPTRTPTPAASSSVVINEVAWAGTAASSTDEWIELYNNGSAAVNLTGWALYEAGGSTKIIDLGGTIAAKGYYLIERTDNTTVNDIAGDKVGSFGGSGLANTGENLVLKNGATVVDQVNCASAWFGGSATGYYTMERKSAVVSGNTASNWGSNNGVTRNGKDALNAALNGTARAKNSITP